MISRGAAKAEKCKLKSIWRKRKGIFGKRFGFFFAQFAAVGVIEIGEYE